MNPQTKAKITWRCRRGMLELDLILGRFIERELDELTDEQTAVFERLLDCPDPDIYAWLMGYEQSTDKDILSFVEFIRNNDSAG